MLSQNRKTSYEIPAAYTRRTSNELKKPSSISSEEEDSFEMQETTLLEQNKLLNGTKTQRTNRTNTITWKRSTLVLAIIVILQLLALTYQSTHSCPDIPATDFPSIRTSTHTNQKRRFTSALHVAENGTLYMDFNTSEPRYIGPPSPQIDKAWEDLTDTRYLRLIPSEISWLSQDTSLPSPSPFEAQKPMILEDGMYGGIDMLHSLHCLNGIRKHLDIEYYEDKIGIPEKYRKLHIEHCMEQLRQAVLCHGDTTPVTLKPIWKDEKGRFHGVLGETEWLHTCRDSERIVEWVKERARLKGAVNITHGA